MGLNRLTKASVDDKIKFMFSVFDLNGDGGITTTELLNFVAEDASQMMESSAFAEECLAKIDQVRWRWCCGLMCSVVRHSS